MYTFADSKVPNAPVFPVYTDTPRQNEEALLLDTFQDDDVTKEIRLHVNILLFLYKKLIIVGSILLESKRTSKDGGSNIQGLPYNRATTN